MDTSRTELLLGKENIKKLKEKNIFVVGIGGVGGIVAEMLVRTGICKLSIIDYDIIEPSNINRQIISLQSNIGKLKVDVLKNRLIQINPDAIINAINVKLTEDNVSQLIEKNCDYVIDAIDSVKDKACLIEYCKKNSINIISAMGTAKKIIAPIYEISDIYKTQNDPLSKVMRKILKERGIKNHKVCYSKQESLQCDGLGSIMWHPTACACVITSEVIKDLLKEN